MRMCRQRWTSTLALRRSPDAWERFSSLPPGPSGLPSRFHATVREAQVACEDWQRQQRHAAESLAAHLHRRVDAAFGRVERVLEDLLAVDGGQPGALGRQGGTP